MHQRTFVFAFAFLLALPSANWCAVAMAGEPQLAHMVFFTLAENTPANRQQLIKACKRYLSKHEGVIHFSAGAAANDLRRDVNDQGFDVSLHMVFANKKAHDKYQTHERHLAFIKENKQLWSRVRVFDSYVHAAPRQEKAILTSVDQALAAKISLDLAQSSLHSAIESIARSLRSTHKIDFPLQIKIIGGDLQSEGITRNQRIGRFTAKQKPLADVLTAITAAANPVRNAPLSAKTQKLVWVVSADKKSIWISTRSGAASRSETLPEVFHTRPTK